MRSPLPATLFGRLFLAIVAVIATTLLLIVLVVARERHELAFAESGSAAAAASVIEICESLARLPREQRGELLERLRAEAIVAHRAARQRHHRHRDLAAAHLTFAEHVQKKLGQDFKVTASPPGAVHGGVIEVRHGGGEDFAARPPHVPGAHERPGPRLFDVLVTLPDGDRVTFRTPSPRGTPPFPRHFFVELGVLTIMLGAVLYAMTRTITRPLADLAAAADAVGRGKSVRPLAERGARELKRATRAFNAMHERLSRYLDSRTRVLAAMSHDLRTPLTRLRLRIESIEDETLRQRCADDLDEMARMVRGALSMFRGLNDEEIATAIDVNALLAQLQRQYAELDASVAIEGAAATPFVGKPLALKRCLSNLIDNAIQYAGRATVLVEDGANLVVRVLDDGPGIAQDLIEQVFEPFFRLESSRNRDTGGTGLGLSIARDVAQAHGGSLTLANRPTGGVEAKLVLPRPGAAATSVG